MKTVEVESIPDQLAKALHDAHGEQILLTHDGKPYAIVSNASFLDEEDLAYMNDPQFWKMIAERRKKRGGVSLDEAFRRLEEREAKERSKP